MFNSVEYALKKLFYVHDIAFAVHSDRFHARPLVSFQIDNKIKDNRILRCSGMSAVLCSSMHI